MARCKLTKRVADNATEPFTWDDSLRGFGLRVTPAGRKSWVIQYRSGARTRRFTLGHYPGLTPAQARKDATEHLARVARGGDPAQDKRDTREAPTVADLAARYRLEHLPKNKATTRQTNERLLEVEILPAFGKRQIASITTSDVSRWHAGFAADCPIMGNRCLFLLATMFGLAERWGWASSNPCRFVDKFPEKGRERHLDDLELRRLGKALAEIENEPLDPGDPVKVDAVRLLLFTGCRKSEILSAERDNVDLDRGLLTLPDSKTGSKIVVLNDAAIEVFRRLLDRSRSISPYVFPGRDRTTHLREFRKVWKRILAKAGIKNFHLHDLRHTLASEGLRAGMTLAAIGSLLGHTRSTTTEKYAHWQHDTKREHASLIGKRLTEALSE